MPSPIKFAHVVLRTARFDEMLEWWSGVLEADVRFANDFIAFLSFDDEHHRVAMISVPVEDQELGRSGVDHVAYTYAGIDDQFETYQRLKLQGIEPYWMIHHGGTLSAYYRDPDGNQVELQVDALTMEDTDTFMRSPVFAANPIGIPVDFDDLVARYEDGESEESILAYPLATA
ncbi:MAG TPA: biphenyl 2,3-dioxygenase [Acidimicrobiaceae bacterium]|nr:biphenyl 2,3-dioxygenase [Acidimicrobiaceae bacterium]